MDRLDPPRLPLLVQNVGSLHDLLTVGAEHALQEGHNKGSVSAGGRVKARDEALFTDEYEDSVDVDAELAGQRSCCDL